MFNCWSIIRVLWILGKEILERYMGIIIVSILIVRFVIVWLVKVDVMFYVVVWKMELMVKMRIVRIIEFLWLRVLVIGLLMSELN